MLPFFKNINFRHVLYYLPAVLVFGFGFLTLHLAFDFIEYYEGAVWRLYDLYGQGESFEVWSKLLGDFHHSHGQLFWAVGLLSVCSCVLFVFMAYFFKRDHEYNAERVEHLKHFENLGAAIDASLDGIAIVDDRGCISFINVSLLLILGFDEGDSDKFLDHSWKLLFDGVNDDALRQRVLDALEERKDWNGEFDIVTPSDDRRIIYMSATAVHGGGHIFTVHDLTLEKQVQREKAELQEQFYQSQKMEAIGRLAGGIAHDFNNILAAINGYAEFLVEDLEEEKALQKFASNILQAGQRAKGLVDQMLTFSRRKENENDVINLAASINESMSMLKASLPRTIDMRSDIRSKEAYIRGNASQITQVLMNLCVNASDAMLDENGTLSVSLSPAQFSDFPLTKAIVDDLPVLEDVAPLVFKEVDDNHTILVLGSISKHHSYHCLSIEDSGTGMSKVIMERIFEPFFTTKPVDKGTGLGMAMVHGAMSAHRGCLVCDSKLGRGTRFDLYFPADLSYTQQQEEQQEILQTEFHDNIVLVVEDQEEVRAMICKMLQRMDLDVEEAENGLEALAILRENPDAFDFVVTDYNMPHMTGLDLIRQAGEEFPAMPFVLLSGYSEEKVRDLIDEQKNVFAALRKPVGKEKLMRVINDLLEQKGE